MKEKGFSKKRSLAMKWKGFAKREKFSHERERFC
jgi:hypothetical protein